MVEGVERITCSSNLARSPKLKSLPKPMSQLLMPGWRRKLREVLPYTPIAGWVKQLMFRRWNLARQVVMNLATRREVGALELGVKQT